MKIQWSNGANVVTGATGMALGTGSANTTKIHRRARRIFHQLCSRLGASLQGRGHADWYLPSKDNRISCTFTVEYSVALWAAYYWSSTEYDASDAYYQNSPAAAWDWNVSPMSTGCMPSARSDRRAGPVTAVSRERSSPPR